MVRGEPQEAMKTPSPRTVILVHAFAVVLGVVAPRAVAQIEVGLSLQTYAGLSITGAVGKVYTVQYQTSLAQPGGWRCAGVVQLASSPHLWFDATAPATEQRFYRAVSGPSSMVWIPPGTFTMGSPTNEAERGGYEGPQTVVTLTRGFFMGKYEVTQGDYESVMGSNPSYFRNGTDGSKFGGSGEAVTHELVHPVDLVTWYDATNYCLRLTSRERLAGRLPEGWAYRLPTEAEWEYACRGGTTTAFHYGPALRSGMANVYGRSEYNSSVGTINNPAGVYLGRTTPVGSYEPNGWGLYDMHGNVWEWCLDGFTFVGLPGGRVVDPRGPSTDSNRMFRGGGWNFYARDCRSALRASNVPSDQCASIGFRVVLLPSGP